MQATTGVRGAADGTTRLVVFQGSGGDPGLFDGEIFYGGQDNYSSTLFFFLDNKTTGPETIYIGFASDDAATLFIDGELILEHLTGRGFGAANTIQNGPREVEIGPGLHLAQLSYPEGCCGSGARVGIWADCPRTRPIDTSRVEVTTSAGTAEPVFKRGDVDASGTPDITDAIVVLGHLFLGDPRPPCFDAADSDDSGSLDITDAVFLLGHLFLGEASPPAPGPESCGTDPTAEPAGSDYGCSYPTARCG